MYRVMLTIHRLAGIAFAGESWCMTFWRTFHIKITKTVLQHNSRSHWVVGLRQSSMIFLPIIQFWNFFKCWKPNFYDYGRMLGRRWSPAQYYIISPAVIDTLCNVWVLLLCVLTSGWSCVVHILICCRSGRSWGPGWGWWWFPRSSVIHFYRGLICSGIIYCVAASIDYRRYWSSMILCAVIDRLFW